MTSGSRARATDVAIDQMPTGGEGSTCILIVCKKSQLSISACRYGPHAGVAAGKAPHKRGIFQRRMLQQRERLKREEEARARLQKALQKLEVVCSTACPRLV